MASWNLERSDEPQMTLPITITDHDSRRAIRALLLCCKQTPGKAVPFSTRCVERKPTTEWAYQITSFGTRWEASEGIRQIKQLQLAETHPFGTAQRSVVRSRTTCQNGKLEFGVSAAVSSWFDV
jgi:hypothetical protein